MANTTALAQSNHLAQSKFSGAWQRASDLELSRRESKFKALGSPLIPLLIKGLQRGAITEITGPRTSGRTACLLHLLAQATQEGEICAFVDTNDQFDPSSATLAGVCLDQLVWVRCNGKVEHAIRATDLLLHAGGFGIIVLDFCETSPKLLNRVPLSYWFRFRQALEPTPTVLLICARTNQAKSCSFNVLNTKTKALHWAGRTNFKLLAGSEISGRLERPVARAPEPMTLAG